jgi:hypothetical protein
MCKNVTDFCRCIKMDNQRGLWKIVKVITFHRPIYLARQLCMAASHCRRLYDMFWIFGSPFTFCLLRLSTVNVTSLNIDCVMTLLT